MVGTINHTAFDRQGNTPTGQQGPPGTSLGESPRNVSETTTGTPPCPDAPPTPLLAYPETPATARPPNTRRHQTLTLSAVSNTSPGPVKPTPARPLFETPTNVSLSRFDLGMQQHAGDEFQPNHSRQSSIQSDSDGLLFKDRRQSHSFSMFGLELRRSWNPTWTICLEQTVHPDPFSLS